MPRQLRISVFGEFGNPLSLRSKLRLAFVFQTPVVTGIVGPVFGVSRAKDAVLIISRDLIAPRGFVLSRLSTMVKNAFVKLPTGRGPILNSVGIAFDIEISVELALHLRQVACGICISIFCSSLNGSAPRDAISTIVSHLSPRTPPNVSAPDSYYEAELSARNPPVPAQLMTPDQRAQ